MSFWQKTMLRFAEWMKGRNGVDPLALATLAASLILQLAGSFPATAFLSLISLALYAWALFRVLSRKSYRREEENRRFLTWWYQISTRIRQFILRWKQRREFKYFKCPECKTLLRVSRGGGEKEISCPRCGHPTRVKT